MEFANGAAADDNVSDNALIRRSLEILLQQDLYTTKLDRTLDYKVSNELRAEYEELRKQLLNFSTDNEFKQELTNLQMFASRYRIFIARIYNEFLQTNASINQISSDQLIFMHEVIIMGGKLQSYNQLMATAANSQGIYTRLREAAILNEIDNKDALEYLRKTRDSDSANKLKRNDIKEIVTTNKKFDSLVGVGNIVSDLRTVIQNIEIGLVETYQFIIFYGVPGTGKTALSESLATEFSNGEYYKFDQSFFAALYVGVTESRIRNIFEKVRSTPDKRFTIVIDEADNVLSTSTAQPHLNSVKILLQTELSSYNSFGTNLLIICITNYLARIDQTFKRRATSIIEVNEPSKESCIDFLESQLTPGLMQLNGSMQQINIKYQNAYKTAIGSRFSSNYVYTNSDMGRLAKNVQDNFLIDKIPENTNYFVIIHIYLEERLLMIYSKTDSTSAPSIMPPVEPSISIGLNENINYANAMIKLYDILSSRRIKLLNFKKYFAPSQSIMMQSISQSSSLTVEQAQIYRQK